MKYFARGRGLFAGFLMVTCFGAITAAAQLRDDSVTTLVARLSDVAATRDARWAAEDVLSTKPAGEVLPALLPDVGKGMPPGGIWNSAGREFDERAPAAWRTFYAVARVWDAQIRNVSDAGGAAILGEMLAKAPTETAKVRILHDIARRPWPGLEPVIATLMKDGKESTGVRTAAALALILHGQGDYHADLLAAFEQQQTHANRMTWLELLVNPRHKAQSGVDRLVVVRGFDLVAAEKAASPGYIHGAYFLVLAIGRYVDHDFMPSQIGPSYATATGLSEAFFADTVENALGWWREHRGEYA